MNNYLRKTDAWKTLTFYLHKTTLYLKEKNYSNVRIIIKINAIFYLK